MRIAAVHNNEIRDNGTASLALAALKELQVEGEIEEVQHFQPRGEIPGKWDAFIYTDDGRDDIKWLPPHPWAYWAIDTHLGYGYRLWKAGHADLVYVAQKDAVESFEADGIKKATWLPLACHPPAHPNREELEAKGHTNLDKVWDFAFVGFLNDSREPGHNNRIDYLDAIFKAFPNSWLSVNVFFEEMAKRFIKARVGFNISIKRDLNMRVFEVMSTGTPLLTNMDVEGINDLFEAGEHYMGYQTYRGPKDALASASAMLEYPECAAKFARKGFQEVRAKHTYKHRMKRILEDLTHV